MQHANDNEIDNDDDDGDDGVTRGSSIWRRK